MGKDVEGCCESCKLFGDAPAAIEAVLAPPLRAAYEDVKVIVSRGGETIAELLPDKERIWAGRVAGNDVVLQSGTISKRQFMLEFGPRGVVLVDGKSTCGTYINGRIATAPTLVPEGATIYAGDFQVRIVPR